jgi:PAS domain S-box-containing protein
MSVKRILIVEDEWIVAFHIQKSIEEMGYEVIGCITSGMEAVETAILEKPDLVLMDIILQGGMNGIEAAGEIIRQIDVPIVYLTAFADDQTLRQAKITEPFGYIIKPFTDRELKTTIDVALFKFELSQKLKESEQRFRGIFQQNFDAIILFNRNDLRVINLNPAAESLFGFSLNDFKTDTKIIFKSDKDYEDFKQKVKNLSQGELCIDQFFVITKSSREMICSIMANIIKLQKEDVLYCSFRDITEKIQSEEELRFLKEKLAHADKMIRLGILVSGVAHEINNPNNSIMLNSMVIQKTWEAIIPILNDYCKLNPDFYINNISYPDIKDKMGLLFSGLIESSRRIQRIVEDLKKFARKEPLKFMEEIDVNQVIISAMNLMDNLIRKSTHYFQVELSEQLPKIRGNFQNLEQVIINLIQNACQSLKTPDHGIVVSSGIDPDSCNIIITVKDEGIGISEENLKYITEPFFTTKRTLGGIGLGLSVSSRIINDHNGSMEFVSNVGQGTQVKVILPILKTDKT